MFIINRDSIETTIEYTKAMVKIGPILDSEFRTGNSKPTKTYWQRKKELLAAEGINWNTPAEMNPDLIKDE